MKLIKAASSNGIYQGVVCSLKDNYGFIERADIVKEIFFHFSEFHDDIQCLALGDDVQFAVQIRNVIIEFIRLFIHSFICIRPMVHSAYNTSKIRTQKNIKSI